MTHSNNGMRLFSQDATVRQFAGLRLWVVTMCWMKKDKETPPLLQGYDYKCFSYYAWRMIKAWGGRRRERRRLRTAPCRIILLTAALALFFWHRLWGVVLLPVACFMWWSVGLLQSWMGSLFPASWLGLSSVFPSIVSVTVMKPKTSSSCRWYIFQRSTEKRHFYCLWYVRLMPRDLLSFGPFHAIFLQDSRCWINHTNFY